MTRLLTRLFKHLEEKGVTREEFVEGVVSGGWGKEATTHRVLEGKDEPCVGIVGAAQEILGLTDEEAYELQEAGRKDASAQMLAQEESVK